MMRIPLLLDNEQLGHIEIGRTRTGADGVHTYHWTVHADNHPHGLKSSSILQHRESDGPFVLLHKVLDAYHTSGFAMMAGIVGGAVTEMNRIRTKSGDGSR
jgi:hypothetical protein